MENKYLIEGGIFKDERGKVVFVNDFDMKDVRRLYHIHHQDTKTIRAWQGHKIETKWFHCVNGAFQVVIIKVDDWENPSKDLQPIIFELNSQRSNVLQIDGGYVNGFRGIEPNSVMMVFSDCTVEESKEDDFRFDKNYWNIDWK